MYQEVDFTFISKFFFCISPYYLPNNCLLDSGHWPTLKMPDFFMGSSHTRGFFHPIVFTNFFSALDQSDFRASPKKLGWPTHIGVKYFLGQSSSFQTWPQKFDKISKWFFDCIVELGDLFKFCVVFLENMKFLLLFLQDSSSISLFLY